MKYLKAILTAYNNDVQKLNNILLNKFNSKNSEKIYEGIDKIEPECEQMAIPVEVLNSLKPSGFPKYKLNLKTGCKIILLRSINPVIGLCNGTKLVINELKNNIINCTIVSKGKFNGNQVDIFRIINKTDNEEVIKFSRTQFPVSLAFALSINKAQGQKIDYVGIYVDRQFFGHGQCYVALSRAKSNKS